MLNLDKGKTESVEQYLWRLGQAKDNGIFQGDWVELTDVINKNLFDNEEDYKTEATYRKPYQQAKRFYDAGIFSTNKEKDLRRQKQEIIKERQRLSDERTALNRELRVDARSEQNLAILEKAIRESLGNFTAVTTPYSSTANKEERDMIVCLSDIHLGLDTKNYFGTYNSDVAKEYMDNYFNHIVDIKRRNGCNNAYVFLLGDIISGNIHWTVQLENRENVITQIEKASELISVFVYNLSCIFDNVYINGVAGNHSRLSKEDEVLRGERLDDLIIWFMQTATSQLDNVCFLDSDNYDSTIGSVTIRGKKYLLIHGDYDSYSDSGLSKLVMMLGYKPEAVFTGHLHHCSYDDISNIKYIRSGSFSGATDNYCIQKRIVGYPTQMVCVVDDNGIESLYPVDLTR